MIFDPLLVEARLSLGVVTPEEMPPIAWAALESQYDGPAIRRMAAFDKPTWFEVDAWLQGFMEETGMQPLSKDRAARRVAYNLAREILDSRKDPLPFLRSFYELWVASDLSAALQVIGNLDDATSWLTPAEHMSYIHDELILFTRTYEHLRDIHGD